MMNGKHFFLHTFLCAVLLCCASASLTAQERLPYDSIMLRIGDKNLSMDEKYPLNKVIDHLPVREQIAITTSLAQWAKKEKDKAKLITLYSMINVHYRNLKEIEKGKMHLDSALLYVDQTEDVDALGALNYQLGNYYFQMDDTETAHAYYYKAIDYYEQSETKQMILSLIYYRLGREYLDREDITSMGKIASNILSVKIDDPYKIYYNNVYSFVATYYNLKAAADSLYKEVYLDSALVYLRKSVDIYYAYKDTAPNPVGAQRTVCQNYYAIANLLLQRDSIESAFDHLKKGERYMIKDDFSTLAKYHRTKGVLYRRRGDTPKAIQELVMAEEYSEKAQGESSNSDLHAIYRQLAHYYASEKDYEQAYIYKRKELEMRTEINSQEQYNAIKELETRYETAKKESEIQLLNAKNAYQHKRNKLYIVLIGVVLLWLFFVIIWFRNKRKADVALLNMAQLKQQEAELKTELETAKREEREREYQILLNETQQRQLKSYLSGLENERSRLARELHDSVSNELVAVHMKIEQDTFDKAALSDTLRTLHSQVRGISHALMPPAFSYAALSDILEDYTGRQQEHRRKNIQLSIEKETEWNALPASAALNVYRIVQEAVTNALKHAGAANIFVRLEKQEDEFRLLIADDGEGFDTGIHTNGIGLKTIRERAENLSGQFTIVSETGKGTEIEVRFPG